MKKLSNDTFSSGSPPELYPDIGQQKNSVIHYPDNPTLMTWFSVVQRGNEKPVVEWLKNYFT